MSEAVPIAAVEVNPKNGVIRKLLLEAGEISLIGGGCEFGQWYAFFSQDKLGGLKVDVTRAEFRSDAQGVQGVFEAGLPFGRYRLEFSDRLVMGALERSYQVESLDQGRLTDLVIRCAAAARDFPEGEILGRRYPHKFTNLFRLHETRRAAFQGKRLRLEFEILDSSAPRGYGEYTYVRDSKNDGWVMHHRLLARNGLSDEYVLRAWRYAFSSRQSFWVKPLRHVLWRVCEKHPWIKPTFQVGGNVFLKPGDRLTMRSRMRVMTAQSS